MGRNFRRVDEIMYFDGVEVEGDSTYTDNPTILERRAMQEMQEQFAADNDLLRGFRLLEELETSEPEGESDGLGDSFDI